MQRVHQEHRPGRRERDRQRNPEAPGERSGAGEAREAVRHAEVPVQREPGASESLPGPQAAGVPMSERHRLRQVGTRAAGVPHMGAHHQRGGDGHAQVEAAARAAHHGHQEPATHSHPRRGPVQRGRQRQRVLWQLRVCGDRQRGRHQGATSHAESAARPAPQREASQAASSRKFVPPRHS